MRGCMTDDAYGAGPETVASARAPAPPRVPVRIRYCTQCRWLNRATWIAQELLTTFPTELELTLEPGFGGIFEVELDGALIFSRAERKRFPEPKELKQKIRDRVDPTRSLGHSDDT
jgi:selenoprotein W-related protein